MAKVATSLETFKADCRAMGLYVDTYSPGDGGTRYRFFTEESCYFAGNGIATVMGRANAELFASGFACGVVEAAKKAGK